MIQKILLTGATGLVGTSLTEEFVRNKFNISAIYRRSKSEQTNISWHLHDISNFNLDFFNSLGKFDVLVHNAASLKLGNTSSEKDEIKKVNIDFTKEIFNWAIQSGIKKILFTSSFSFISKPLPNIITENALVSPSNFYSESKYLCEEFLKDIASKKNINYYIFRISSPVSIDLCRMPNNVLKKWLKQSMSGESIKVYGKGKRTQDFVAVTDIAKAFSSCINNNYNSGIYNIASGNSLSMSELAKKISSKFNNAILYSNKDDNENDRWNISIDKARRELNYSPEYTSEEIISKLILKSADENSNN